MPEKYLQIVYDPQTKIWKSVNYPYGDVLNKSLGDEFLKSMRSIDSNKVIDYFYDSNISKTAKDVYEQSILIALNLKRLGVKKGDIIILFSMNNEWSAVLTFGCILIGALPNFFEVHMDADDTSMVFDLLQPKAIIYEEKYLTKIQKAMHRSKIENICQLISIDNAAHQPNVEKDLLKSPESPVDFDSFKSVEIKDPQQEIACLALTSGSTGIPKVVQITHALMMHGCSIWWDNEDHYAPLTSDSVIFSFSPLRWISQVAVIVNAMLKGLKRVSSCGAPTGKYGFEVLRNSGITHIFVAPSILHEILLELDENDTESLKSLKIIQLGGEPASKILVELTRKHAVNAKPFQCYGMTEMCSCITNDEHINGGKPLPGYEIQILDDNLQPLGPNQNGQIALRPVVPLLGYKTPDNKGKSGQRDFFINGDYGVMDDEHNLHVLSRYKDLIRSNGHVIIPNTLEYIINSLPEVYVARLAGYRKSPDDPNEIGAFFVVLNRNVTKSQSEVSAKIFETLSAHLSPAELAVIQKIHYVDAVPLTTCGKVNRVVLKELAASKS